MNARIRKRSALVALLLLLSLLLAMPTLASDSEESEPAATTDYGFTVDARGAILIEAETGTVLYEQNADAAYSPASVTKIMTLLLVMEALDSGKIALTDKVSVSENAASMGGSQVFLEVGETMTVEEMIKCTVIASANDAAVALAEFVSGSESAFVAEMNRRASELNMTNTHFENVTGIIFAPACMPGNSILRYITVNHTVTINYVMNTDVILNKIIPYVHHIIWIISVIYNRTHKMYHHKFGSIYSFP